MSSSSLLSADFKRAIDFLRSGDAVSAERVCRGLRSDVATDAQRQLLAAIEKDVKKKFERSGVHNKRLSPPSVARDFLIVTPTFNSERYLLETLESVKANSEGVSVYYHIQDGGSDDRTLDIVREFAEKNSGSGFRVSWASASDGGMYDAINRGFSHLLREHEDSLGESVMMTWINSDDALAAYSLATVSKFAHDNPAIAWLTGVGSLIDGSGRMTGLHDEPKAYSQRSLQLGAYDGESLPFVQQEGTFWSKSLWVEVGGLDANYRLAGDWDLWRRFAQYQPLVKIDAVLAHHRRHAGQLSSDIQSYRKEIKRSRAGGGQVADQAGGRRLRALYDSQSARWNVVDIGDDRHREKTKDVGTVLPASHQASVAAEFEWPKISVVTPSYNQGNYIEETILSVLNQSYPNLEYIVVDGGSSDNTLEVIDRYSKDIDVVISEPDDGQSDAINKGFGYATGDILTWLNSDDQYQADALFQVALKYICDKPDLMIGICEVFEDDALVHRHLTSNEVAFPISDILDLDSGWNAGQFVFQPECFFTRSIWEKTGGYVRTDCYYSMDYELWARMALAGAEVGVIGSPLVRFRSHPDQKTADPSKFKKELRKVRELIIEEHGLPDFEKNRPSPSFGTKLKVAFVNDHGFKFGAGIAHHRMYASFDLGGHELSVFSLEEYGNDSALLAAEVASFVPDLIVCGNLHSAGVKDLDLLSFLDEIAPVFWVTHDFWLLTGRCAYMGGCKKYLYGCDVSCPTAGEYPRLAPEDIYGAWEAKWSTLASLKQTRILANSKWAADRFRSALVARGVNIPVDTFTLGAPVEVFKPVDKRRAKEGFGVPGDEFVIAMSVSSLSDERKGAQYLIEAVKSLRKKEGVHLLVTGNADRKFPDVGVPVTYTGYLVSQNQVSQAMNAADIYVGPSLEETYGQVFVEAALCGVPSVGFEGTGTDDAVRHGVTGLLVKNGSSEALKDAIDSFVLDVNFLDRIRFATRLYAVGHWSLEKMYHSLFNVLNRSGIVDRKGLPHQVSFKNESVFLTKEDLSISLVRGFDSWEGPYARGEGPDFKFCWMVGETSSIELFSEVARSVNLELSVCNLVFDSQCVDIYLNGACVLRSAKIPKGDRVVSLCVNHVLLQKGVNDIDIHASEHLSGDPQEARKLSLAFTNISADECESPEEICCLMEKVG